MRPTTRNLILALCIVGFAVTLYNAGAGSGTEDGGVWLLASLIVGIALIAFSLSLVAQIHTSNQSGIVAPRGPSVIAGPNPLSAAPRPATPGRDNPDAPHDHPASPRNGQGRGVTRHASFSRQGDAAAR